MAQFLVTILLAFGVAAASECISGGAACGEGICVDGTCYCRQGAVYSMHLGKGSCVVGPSSFAYYKSLCLLGCLLLVGKTLRIIVPIFQWFFLPASIIAGLIFFAVMQILYVCDPVLHAHVLMEFTVGWDKIPPFAVDVLFASLFLGVPIPRPAVIWAKAGPQLVYNQLLNWGMWCVSVLVVCTFCVPVMGASPFLAVLVPTGFTGGHSMTLALAGSFDDVGYAEGVGLGLFVSTVGQLASFILGVFWVNVAARRDLLSARPKEEVEGKDEDAEFRTSTRKKMYWMARGLYPGQQQPSMGAETTYPDSINTLSLHLAVVMMAMFLGIYLSELLQGYIQRFVCCMAVGILIQLCYMGLVQRNVLPPILDARIMTALQGLVLDFLIVSAMSVVDIESIWSKLPAACVVCAACLIYQGVYLWWGAPHLLPNHWFERGICEFGQSTGVLSSGLILLKMCDPGQALPVLDAFALKNFVAMPVLFTWLPYTIYVIQKTSAWVVFAISSGHVLVCLVSWYFYFRPRFCRGVSETVATCSDSSSEVDGL
eukprot:TRINITY_DN16038_c0_g1_i1.p1 TRINITY_DN16038_c0_g1~~TRINITY_DN16038_c0_g1_i1.p1  ORF type:complete len:541 (+),score=63.05 TRINITY_DN16038_c0_g1_i1:88-1710(+)